MVKDAATPAPAAAQPFRYFRLVPAANATADRSGPAATIEQSRRQQLARRVASSAEDALRAVDTVRAFDRTGNISDALPHLIASAEATLTNARALAADIQRALPRTDIPEESAAADTASGDLGRGTGMGIPGGGMTIHLVNPAVTPALLARAEFQRRAGVNRG